MIDKQTGLMYVVKRPSPERRYYGFDFSRLLTGIKSIHSITITPSININDLIYTDAIISGTVVDIYLEKGILGTVYSIYIVVEDYGRNVIEERALIKLER